MNTFDNTMKRKRDLLEKVSFEMRVKRLVNKLAPSDVKTLEVKGRLPTVKVNVTPTTLHTLSFVVRDNFKEPARVLPVLETS